MLHFLFVMGLLSVHHMYILQTNTTYVYELIKAKKLPALKLGSYKIRHSALVEFLTINEDNDLTDPYNIKPL